MISNEMENMKLGYEYIRDRKVQMKHGFLDIKEYLCCCMGYITALEETGSIEHSKTLALNDFIYEDTDLDIAI